MNIFLRELRANLKSLVIWSVIIILLVMIATAKFSAFAGDPEMLKILDTMPPAVLDAMNMRAFNLTTLSGPTSLALSINRTNGAMTGSFFHPVTQAETPLTGVIVKGIDEGGGMFFGPGQTGSFSLQKQ